MRQVFYKRAQIFVGDLNGMCPLLKGLEQLTGFADYRILRGLLSWDVIDITPELRARIMAREELCPGSEDEVEIRATALVTIRAIQQLFAEHRRRIDAYRVDWFTSSYGEACLMALLRTPHVENNLLIVLVVASGARVDPN